MSDLQVKIGDLTFDSPIVVASGPLTDSADLIKKAEDCGAGAVSTKLTLFKQPIKGYRRMFAVRDLYNFNCSDKRNDFEEGLDLVRKTKKITKLPVFTNIAGNGDDLDSWQTIARAMQEEGADVLELNFCCQNMAFSEEAKSAGIAGQQIGKQPPIMLKIIKAVKEAVKIPVSAKVSATGVDFVKSVRAVEEGGADMMACQGSQMSVPPIDIYNGGVNKMANFGNSAFGAACGPANKQLGKKLVADVVMNSKLVVVGGGGVENWEDVVELIMFGGTLVPMCTKLLWDGFDVITKINKRLLRFMENQGYKTLEDMRGLALKHVTTPDKLIVYDSLPHIDEEKCVACGKCTKVGSCVALTLVDKKIIVEESKCFRCGLCGCLCPENAISFSKPA